MSWGYKTYVHSLTQKQSAMIGCLRARARKQPIVALYFEFENELKFYDLRTSSNMTWREEKIRKWLGLVLSVISSLVIILLWKRERVSCFALVVFLLLCYCLCYCVSFSRCHGLVCSFGISWSFSPQFWMFNVGFAFHFTVNLWNINIISLNASVKWPKYTYLGL